MLMSFKGEKLSMPRPMFMSVNSMSKVADQPYTVEERKLKGMDEHAKNKIRRA